MKKGVGYEITYLEEFREYVKTNIAVTPKHPKDKAKIIFSFSEKKAISILTKMKISEKRIKAIRMVAKGYTYIQVASEFDCSSETIKNWINTTYSKLVGK